MAEDQVHIGMSGQEVLAHGFALLWRPVCRLLSDDFVIGTGLVQRSTEAFRVQFDDRVSRITHHNANLCLVVFGQQSSCHFA